MVDAVTPDATDDDAVGIRYYCGLDGCTTFVCYERVSLRGRRRGRHERKQIAHRNHHHELRCRAHTLRIADLPVSLEGVTWFLNERARTAVNDEQRAWFTGAAELMRTVCDG